MICPITLNFWQQENFDTCTFLEETIKDPSRLKWTADIGSEWAGRFFNCVPVLTSQILTLSSKLPDTIRFDCGLNPQQRT